MKKSKRCRLLSQLYSAKKAFNRHIIRRTIGKLDKLQITTRGAASIIHGTSKNPKYFSSILVNCLFSFLKAFHFTVWSKHGQPQQSVPGKADTCLRHEPTRWHILNTCTCAHICTHAHTHRENQKCNHAYINLYTCVFRRVSMCAGVSVCIAKNDTRKNVYLYKRKSICVCARIANNDTRKNMYLYKRESIWQSQQTQQVPFLT